jgi:hypothetical protein
MNIKYSCATYHSNSNNNNGIRRIKFHENNNDDHIDQCNKAMMHYSH